MRNSLFRSRRVTIGLVAGLVVASSISDAVADCTPDPATDGDTIACLNVDGDGFDGSSLNSITIHIDTTAVVDQDPVNETAISAGADAVIENNGLLRGRNGIIAGTDSAIENRGDIVPIGTGIEVGDGSAISNTGSIQTPTASDGTVTGISFGSNVTLINDGLINMQGSRATGVHGGLTGNKITNNGTIRAESESGSGFTTGIRVNAFSTVINNGEIWVSETGNNGSGRGIWGSGPQNTIENHGLVDVLSTSFTRGITTTGGDQILNTGSITAVSTDQIAAGVHSINDFTVTNDGTIFVSAAGTAWGVVSADTLDVTNSGEIFATGSPGIGISTSPNTNSISHVVNTGTITADVSILGSSAPTVLTPGRVFIENSGVINGAIELGLGDDELENLSGGQIVGSISMGDGRDILTNAGAIVGDIDLGSGNDWLILESGAHIEGIVEGVVALFVLGDAELEGAFINLDQLTVEGAHFRLSGGVSSSNSTSVFEDAIFSLNSHLIGQLLVQPLGRLEGSGVAEGLVRNWGVIAPGDSVGTLHIDGDYIQLEPGALEIEFSSAAADKLEITGTATLNGTLEILLQADSVGSLEGKTFTILISDGGVVGQFDKDGIVEEGFWTVDISTLGSQVNATFLDVNVPLGISTSASGVFQSSLARAISKAAGN